MKKIFPKGTVKRIHVNQHIIRDNKKTGGTRNVLTIQTATGPFRGSSIVINGSSKTVYQPQKPLSCGAHIWVETTAEVEVEDCEKSTKENSR